MNAPRVDVPAGTIPPIRDFIRHVWRYRDESGETVLTAPPVVFTVVLDDPDEANISMTAISYLTRNLGFEDKIRSVLRGPNVLLEFRDLYSIHAFLSVLSMHAHSAPAREVADYCLSMLGFRWT